MKSWKKQYWFQDAYFKKEEKNECPGVEGLRDYYRQGEKKKTNKQKQDLLVQYLSDTVFSKHLCTCSLHTHVHGDIHVEVSALYSIMFQWTFFFFSLPLEEFFSYHTEK